MPRQQDPSAFQPPPLQNGQEKVRASAAKHAFKRVSPWKEILTGHLVTKLCSSPDKSPGDSLPILTLSFLNVAQLLLPPGTQQNLRETLFLYFSISTLYCQLNRNPDGLQ